MIEKQKKMVEEKCEARIEAANAQVKLVELQRDQAIAQLSTVSEQRDQAISRERQAKKNFRKLEISCFLSFLVRISFGVCPPPKNAPLTIEALLKRHPKQGTRAHRGITGLRQGQRSFQNITKNQVW